MTIIIQQKNAKIVLESNRGPQGVRGQQGIPGVSTDGGTQALIFLADGNISGHKVVKVTTPGKVGYADSNNASHAHTVVGVTANAALSGDDVNVQYSGKMVEPSWNWSINQPVFCGVSGALTQVPPLSGFLLIVGIAVAPDTVLLNIKSPITL